MENNFRTADEYNFHVSTLKDIIKRNVQIIRDLEIIRDNTYYPTGIDGVITHIRYANIRFENEIEQATKSFKQSTGEQQ